MIRVHAGYLPWQGWDGWQVDNGYLFPPGFRRHGLKPGDINALPYLLQLVAEYQRKERDLRTMYDQAETCQQMPEKIRTRID